MIMLSWSTAQQGSLKQHDFAALLGRLKAFVDGDHVSFRYNRMLRRVNLRERLKITGNPRMGAAAEHLAVQLTPVTTPHTPASPGPFGNSPDASSTHASPAYETAPTPASHAAHRNESGMSPTAAEHSPAGNWRNGESAAAARDTSHISFDARAAAEDGADAGIASAAPGSPLSTR